MWLYGLVGCMGFVNWIMLNKHLNSHNIKHASCHCCVDAKPIYSTAQPWINFTFVNVWKKFGSMARGFSIKFHAVWFVATPCKKRETGRSTVEGNHRCTTGGGVKGVLHRTPHPLWEAWTSLNPRFLAKIWASWIFNFVHLWRHLMWSLKMLSMSIFIPNVIFLWLPFISNQIKWFITKFII